MTALKFTYQEYTGLIDLLRANGFTFERFANSPTGRRKVYLRHDIDMSIDDALSLASLERDLDVNSTYYVMLDTELYNVLTPGAAAKLRDIAGRGHDIGLHYVQQNENYDAQGYDANLITDISKQCELLSSILELDITSFSFHRPAPEILRKNIVVAGYSNAYVDPYFIPGAYISDSNHHWRCGDPYAFINEFKGENLQVLTHPFWWNPEAIDPGEKLISLVGRLKSGHQATLIRDVKLAQAAFANSSG